MRRSITRAMAILTVLLGLCPAIAASADLAGRKTVALQSNDGDQIVIGHVEITADGGAYTFRLALADKPFGDYFLAMRPFKCLTGPKQHLCHFAYKDSGRFTANDLTELEYALLFLHKPLASVNVDPWNGLYYEMRIESGRILGTLHDVDLSLITAPVKETARPIGKEHLQAAGPKSYWLPRLVIE